MKKYIGILIVLGVLVLSAPMFKTAKADIFNYIPRDSMSATAVLSTTDASAQRVALKICSSTGTAQPWIQVLSPNGGESYVTGQKITVKWTSCNISI